MKARIIGVLAALAAFATAWAQDPAPTFELPDTSGITTAIGTGATSFMSSFVELLSANLPVVVGIGVMVLVLGWVFRNTIGRLMGGGILGGKK